MKKLVFVALMTIVFCGFAGAQQNCQTLQAILQAQLVLPAGWTGPVYGTLGKDTLVGTFSGTKQPTVVPTGGVVLETGLEILWKFGDDGTITTDIPVGMYPPFPETGGSSRYSGYANIIGGTGRFKNASGTLSLSGVFLVYFTKAGDPTSVTGRWNAELTGTLCGATPK